VHATISKYLPEVESGLEMAEESSLRAETAECGKTILEITV
jgi:hypothetical protein